MLDDIDRHHAEERRERAAAETAITTEEKVEHLTKADRASNAAWALIAKRREKKPELFSRRWD